MDAVTTTVSISDLGALGVALTTLAALVRVLEQLVRKRLTGDRRDPDNGRLDRLEMRMGSVETDVGRMRDGLGRIHERLDVVAQSQARIEGRLERM